MNNEKSAPGLNSQGQFVSQQEAHSLAMFYIERYMQATGARTYDESKHALLELANCGSICSESLDEIARNASAALKAAQGMERFTVLHTEAVGKPMSRGEYNAYRGWKIPPGENPDDKGWLVIFNAFSAEHHETWLPAKVFQSLFVLSSGEPAPATESLSSEKVAADETPGQEGAQNNA
ncbi:MAG: hypothetical protein SAqTSB_38740 [Shewanella algae]